MSILSNIKFVLLKFLQKSFIIKAIQIRLCLYIDVSTFDVLQEDFIMNSFRFILFI